MIVPLWVVAWIIIRLITAPWRELVLYDSAWLWIPAIALLIFGFWIYRKAGLNFSKDQLYGLSELTAEHSEQRLVTTGIRARIRHPVYLGHLCEMLAWTVGSGLLVCYALTVLAMVTGAFMIRREDAELQNRFGDSYRDYRDSVPALFPKL